jgi:hypothetical protein
LKKYKKRKNYFHILGLLLSTVTVFLRAPLLKLVIDESNCDRSPPPDGGAAATGVGGGGGGAGAAGGGGGGGGGAIGGAVVVVVDERGFEVGC